MQIDVDDYQSQIAQMRFGKRVGTSIYFHQECVSDLPAGIEVIARSVQSLAHDSKFKFNVYKFDTRAPLVSLLSYPCFFDDAFPTLCQSAIWELATNTLSARQYSSNDTRPVLHRKELLLPVAHDRIDEFAELTEIAENAGLFGDAARIGRYGYWKSLLEESGLKVIGNALYRIDGRPLKPSPCGQDILRYRTALKRNRLSVPVQMLFKHDLIDEAMTFFDYGCGRGDDIRQLCELGVTASGWDPHYAANEEKKFADVVNLGYVVNVIEDPEERTQAISESYHYARRVLVVSALVGVSNYSRQVRTYRDGVLTSAGTFQKYFQSHELSELIKASVAVDPIAVAPGIMFVFKDDMAEQIFMSRRLNRRQRRHVRPIIRDVNELDPDLKADADRYWQACLELGRPATYNEIEEFERLAKYFSSSRQLFNILSKEKDSTEFEIARQQRKNELLVEFALSQFGRRLYFKYFPRALKRDIEYHFGNYSALSNEAKSILYSIADTEALLAACVDATDSGIGYLLNDQSLQLHIDLLAKLKPILRVYVGCAGILYGELTQIDLIKVHIQSGKVSFMGYDDFEGRPIPDLLERVKVRMWEREVDFFDYIGHFVPTPLLMKSLYIDESFSYFEDQMAFDRNLMKRNLLDCMQSNITRDQLHETLRYAGLKISGYEIIEAA